MYASDQHSVKAATRFTNTTIAKHSPFYQWKKTPRDLAVHLKKFGTLSPIFTIAPASHL
jgi:hypothetical protein